MTKPVYYNDNDPFAARWLRNLVSAGLLSAGDVDDRSIKEVSPDDLKGYEQCHFFAGIGGWPYALGLAGWPVDRPVWTGSCPCQPLSGAGQHKGHADERHVWPAFFGLIAECRPLCIFGEQSASKDGREWLSGVRADLETLGYACGGADLPAAGVAAPHVRSRLYWVADAEGQQMGTKTPWTHQGAMNEAERVGLRSSDLQTVVQVMVGDRLPLAGWPTPDASAANINDSTWQERQAKLREKYNNGNGFGMTLGMAVRIAGWGTPQARDWKDVGDLSNIPINGYLPRQVRGAITNGSGAPTQRLPLADSIGALNPQFSCWLMGYPQEWVSCAASVTP